MMKVYGIKNCDTVKKALNWLKENDIPYEFHDFRKSGISGEKLSDWSAKVGWETLLNRKGTTWRQLDSAVKEGITTGEAALQLMQDKTSVIRRPVIEDGDKLILGFNESEYKASFVQG